MGMAPSMGMGMGMGTPTTGPFKDSKMPSPRPCASTGIVSFTPRE